MQVFAGGHRLQHLALPAGAYGRFDVVTEYREEAVARAVTDLALRLLNHLLIQSESRFDFGKELDRRVTELIRQRSRWPHLDAVIRAAERRGIPIRYAYESESIIELGTGAFMQRYWGMNTSKTPGHRCPRLVQQTAHDPPSARAWGCRWPNRALPPWTVEEALAAAERIGYPVVVKPQIAAREWVSVLLHSHPQASAEALRHREGGESRGAVLVERYVAGAITGSW